MLIWSKGPRQKFRLNITGSFINGRFYETGYKAGSRQGKVLGTAKGYAFGVEKGFELWEELGFYEGFAEMFVVFEGNER